MNRPRSIRARVITLYVVTISLIFVCFGGYTYWGFKQYLVASLRESLARRAHQIAVTILADVPQKGEACIGSEVQIRYAPELNERIVRVTNQQDRTVYASQNAEALPEPLKVNFTDNAAETTSVSDQERSSSGMKYQVVAVGYQGADGARYVVEVGATESDISSALGGLLLTPGARLSASSSG